MNYQQWSYWWRNQANDSGHNAALLELTASIYHVDKAPTFRRRYIAAFWPCWRWAPRQEQDQGE